MTTKTKTVEIRDDYTPGSIIILQSEVHPSGFVSLLYDGLIVAAFMKDILAKADVVK